MHALESETRITQWGNSKATRIPSRIVKELGLKENQAMSITVKDNVIMMTPIQKQPTSIYELCSQGGKTTGIVTAS
ncbi:MAG: AbrB/MazE/SpoVT family DNA-binding domain-containing protein [Micrococcaceae bacterium]